ncbi:hypothetical protein [Microcoleus sp. EPA2]|uniref:hypothetical protein n=1 Tax=Microcoleus sp. EPA2 TaxID=2841654 RepID=UPI00312BBF0F
MNLQHYNYYLVLDIEATCCNRGNLRRTDFLIGAPMRCLPDRTSANLMPITLSDSQPQLDRAILCWAIALNLKKYCQNKLAMLY